MKQLLLGNEAVARGLYEAGVRVVSSYPGTPSTEITEAAAKFVVNGLPMKKSQPKLLQVHPLPVLVLFVL